MPRYVKVSVEQFGTFGLVLAAASWLVAFGFVVIVMALVGRVFAEHPWWGRLVDRAAGRRPCRRGGSGRDDGRPVPLSPQKHRPSAVGVAGFEPTTSASRTQRATKLRYTPMEARTV